MTFEQAQDVVTPNIIGPTWATKEDGSWDLPEHSLGWDMIGWCAENLQNPETQQPWTFTPEQLRFVLHWYAIDENGAWMNYSGVLQRMKGWG